MKEKILSQLLEDVIAVEFSRKYLYSWEWKFKTEEQKGRGNGEGRRGKERRGKRGKERKGGLHSFFAPSRSYSYIKRLQNKGVKNFSPEAETPSWILLPTPQARANGLNYFCRAGKTSCPEQRPLARWRLILRIQASQNWKRISLFLIINW